jgi:hypothetical protein
MAFAIQPHNPEARIAGTGIKRASRGALLIAVRWEISRTSLT